MSIKSILSSGPAYLSLRCILGAIFIYAGVLKISDTTAFAIAIDTYGLVPWSVAKLAGMVLPVVEIVTGLGLILDIRGALGMIVAQLLMFMGVLVYAIAMGLDVDCGCFGPSDPESETLGTLWPTLYRDMLMFGACLFMYWQRRARGVQPRSILRLLTRKT